MNEATSQTDLEMLTKRPRNKNRFLRKTKSEFVKFEDEKKPGHLRNSSYLSTSEPDSDAAFQAQLNKIQTKSARKFTKASANQARHTFANKKSMSLLEVLDRKSTMRPALLNATGRNTQAVLTRDATPQTGSEVDQPK